MRIVRRILAVFLGLLVGLGLAELGARLGPSDGAANLFYGGPIAMPNGIYQPSNITWTEPVPGYAGTLRTYGWEVYLRFNSFGLRGAEPTEGPKWLAVGDSFTLGMQVSEEETFEGLLSERFGVQVLNAGIDHFSTVQSALRYEQIADKLPIDTVIATFFLGNDLRDNEQVRGLLARLRHGSNRPRVLWHPPSDPIAQFAFENSVLVSYGRVAYMRYKMLGEERFKKELAIFTVEGKGQLTDLMRYTVDALAQLKQSTAARGDRLLVALAPAAHSVDPAALERLLADVGLSNPDVQAPRQAVLTALEDLEIATCDLTPPLAAAVAAGDQPYFRFDGHWNALGHSIAANTLEGCLRALPAATVAASDPVASDPVATEPVASEPVASESTAPPAPR